MTEAEWLTSEDPWTMLKWLLDGSQLPISGPRRMIRRPKDRKLELFACACCHGVSEELGRDAERCVEWQSGPAKNASNWAMAWAGDQRMPTSKQRADFLRDVVGNPYRPLRLAKCPHCEGSGFVEATQWSPPNDGPCRECRGTGSPWLTSAVMSVARAVHGDRRFGELPVLADALEDAGCPEEEVCPRCGGAGMTWNGGLPGDPGLPPGYARCRPSTHDPRACTGRRPHPLLAHLRSPGPHVPRCHALDLLLGKG